MDRPTDSIRVVAETDVLSLARIARSTWKNWVGKGLINEPANGMYGESDVVELVAVEQLVEWTDLGRALTAWKGCRDRVLAMALALDLADPTALDAVIDLHTLDVVLATDATELHGIVRAHRPFPRGQLVLALSELVCEARRGFWKRAVPSVDLTKDKRRKASIRRKGRQSRAR